MAERADNARRAWWAIPVVLGLVLGFAFQGMRGLWSPDEGRYAECAREMVVTGDWITPRLSGSIHFTKPPLTYWAIASGIRLLGANEWGVRLHLVYAYALTTLVVMVLGAQMWDRKTGFAAGLVYTTMAFPFAAANVVTTDTLLTLWETLSVLCFWKAFTTAKQPSKTFWTLGVWAAAGAGFLTKGPAALLPVGVIVAFLLLQQNRPGNLLELTSLPGVLVFAGIGLTWYLYAANLHEGLLPYFLTNEIGGRFSGVHGRNPAWYKGLAMYPPIILVGCLPWTAAWPMLWSRWRNSCGGPITLKQLMGHPRLFFLMLWFGVPLLVFVVIPSRLPLYVLPLFPPVAVATARGLVRYTHLLRDAPLRLPRRTVIVLGVWAAVLLGLKLATAFAPSQWDDRSLWTNIQHRLKKEAIVVVGANARRHGVTFYSKGEIEMLERSPTLPPPLSAKERRLGQRITELARTGNAYAVLVKTEQRPSIRKFAHRAGFPSRLKEVGQGFELIIYRPRSERD